MTDVQKALADLKARQEAGEQMPCPRCGKDTMKPALCTNALSRVADGIFVCDDCGTQEALLAFMRNPMPVDEWAFLNPDLPDVDFKDLPGKAVWEQIRMDHGPALISITDQHFQALDTGGTRCEFQTVPAGSYETLSRTDTDLGAAFPSYV